MKRRRIGRYHTQRESIIFEDSDFDEDGHLKEEGEEDDGFTDQSFLAHAERLSAWARACLRERGLPDCSGVSFPPGKPEEWEACEESLDSPRLRPRRNWSRLDLYLREHRGVRDDEAEDLAARIVCEAYELKRARTNNLAMECAYRLGELAIQCHIYAELDGPRKKPRQPKLKPGTLAACVNLVNSNPEISNNEAWIAFDATRIAGEDIYRDGDRLVEVDRSGRDASISRRTFDRYMTVARSRRSKD